MAVMSALGQGMLDHVAGGCLSVSSCHNNDFHIFGRDRENVPGDLHGDRTGESGASAAGLPQDRAGQLAGCDREYGLDLIRFFHGVHRLPLPLPAGQVFCICSAPPAKCPAFEELIVNCNYCAF